MVGATVGAFSGILRGIERQCSRLDYTGDCVRIPETGLLHILRFARLIVTIRLSYPHFDGLESKSQRPGAQRIADECLPRSHTPHKLITGQQLRLYNRSPRRQHIGWFGAGSLVLPLVRTAGACIVLPHVYTRKASTLTGHPLRGAQSMSKPYYPFVRWSTEHFAALGCTVAVAAILLYFGSKCREKGRQLICRILAAVVALQFLSEFAWRAVSDAYGSWQYNLPLHFCSFMSIFAFIALWWRWRPACTLVYFGVLVGSIQGLITPAMANGYPSMAFFVFFIAHGLLLIVALSIPVLQGWRARGYDDVNALVMMDTYVLLIIPVNMWLNTNYGYTQGAPIEGTLLDYLGTAPWYYLWAQLPVLAVFRLLMLPVHDKREE